MATRTLAWAYAEAGDHERARGVHEENLARARALEFRYGEAVTLGSLASIALEQGRVEESISMQRENLRIVRDLGNPLEAGISLCGAARTLAFLGQGETAAQLLACYEALCEDIGASVPWVAKMNEQTLVTIGTQLDEAAFAEASEWGPNADDRRSHRARARLCLD